jgi:cell division protein FtsZ
MMGTGESSGENRAVKACEIAISNPLLDDISIKGAKGVLVNMTGGPDMTLFEADIAVNTIRKEVDSNANIIFGTAFNENMKGKIRISVVATGIDQEEAKKEGLKTESKSFRLSNPTTKKTFFDPGTPSKPKQQEITEITDKNFQTKKSITENFAKQNITQSNQENIKTNHFEQNSLPQSDDESFTEQEEDFIIDTSLSNHKKSITTTSHNQVSQNNTEFLENVEPKNVKKETSGFNLFSFMNGKEKSNENHNKKHTKHQEDELEKKKQQFFGTVFEEDNKEEELNDDIINIPAFFRRKK